MSTTLHVLIVVALLIVAGVAEWDVCKSRRRCAGKLPEDIQ